MEIFKEESVLHLYNGELLKGNEQISEYIVGAMVYHSNENLKTIGKGCLAGVVIAGIGLGIYHLIKTKKK